MYCYVATYYTVLVLHILTSLLSCAGAKFNEKRKLLAAGQKRRLDSAGETSCSSVEDTSSKSSTVGNSSPADGWVSYTPYLPVCYNRFLMDFK